MAVIALIDYYTRHYTPCSQGRGLYICIMQESKRISPQNMKDWWKVKNTMTFYSVSYVGSVKVFYATSSFTHFAHLSYYSVCLMVSGAGHLTLSNWHHKRSCSYDFSNGGLYNKVSNYNELSQPSSKWKWKFFSCNNRVYYLLEPNLDNGVYYLLEN